MAHGARRRSGGIGRSPFQHRLDHDHRGGVVYKSFPLNGLGLVGMGTGHMCNPDARGLEYTINPGWEQGFGIGYVIDDKAHLQFIPIRHQADGLTCVVDGKVFVN